MAEAKCCVRARVCVCEDAYVFVACHQCVLGSIVKQQVSDRATSGLEREKKPVRRTKRVAAAAAAAAFY